MRAPEFFTKQWFVLGFIFLTFLFAYYFASFLLGFSIGISGIILIGRILSAPKYKGSPSRNFNGTKFLNPTGAKASGLGALIKWLLLRQRAKWEKLDDFEYGEMPQERVDSGLRITFVNHSTFLIQLSGLNILTDPVWSERASPFSWAGPKRMRPPGIRFEDIPAIDTILLSHNHYDHLDIATLKSLCAKFHPRVFTPLGVKTFLDKNMIEHVLEMDWWDEISLKEGVQLVSVPAQHFSGRGMFDRDATLWMGFVIKRMEGSIYFAGDTGYNSSTFIEIGKRFTPISVALLPIGAYKPQWFMSPIHVSPTEAVKIHQDIKAKKSIATHFGTFPLADEGPDEPIIDLRLALRESGLSEDDFIVMVEGSATNFS